MRTKSAYGCVTIRGQLQLRVKVEAIQGVSTSFEKNIENRLAPFLVFRKMHLYYRG